MEGEGRAESQGPNVMHSTVTNKQTWGGATILMPEATTDNGIFFLSKLISLPLSLHGFLAFLLNNSILFTIEGHVCL